MWQALCSLLMSSEIRLQTLAGRIVIVAYWFMVLVLLAIYTGDLITRLATKKVHSTYIISYIHNIIYIYIYTKYCL